jgi:hypothetical protein
MVFLWQLHTYNDQLTNVVADKPLFQTVTVLLKFYPVAGITPWVKPMPVCGIGCTTASNHSLNKKKTD